MTEQNDDQPRVAATGDSQDSRTAAGNEATPSLREQLAALAHEQWSGWMRHLFRLSIETGDGCEEIQREEVERWQRQMQTPYADLSDAEKDSDRKEADRVLALLPTWRDIETAPTDGTEVLVAAPGRDGERLYVFAARHNHDWDGWWEVNNDPTDVWGGMIHPTHWMPLPEPPQGVDAVGQRADHGRVPTRDTVS